MRSVVLLSAGRHAVSGRPMPVPVEMQAIRLACDLGAAPYGLHVGADPASVRDALGHGLPRLVVVQGGDLLPALLDYLQRIPPDLIFAGRRGQGGSDSGMLPYRLAHKLGWPIIADVAHIMRGDDGWDVEQVLPRGNRRVVRITLPCVVTVHPAAPTPRPFCYAGLHGEVELLAGTASEETATPELRPYRSRPRMMQQATAGGRLFSNLSPEAAAETIVEELRRLKILGE